MKLDEVLGGLVYVDTNVLYMYLRSDPSHLPVIRAFLSRVVRGEVKACVGAPVVDELFYRLLLARLKDHTGRNANDVLREDPVRAVSEHGPLVTRVIRQVLHLPNVSVHGVEEADAYHMLDSIVEFSLLPRDALHLVIMRRLGITDVASDDADFDRVPGLNRHWIINPSDKAHV